MFFVPLVAGCFVVGCLSCNHFMKKGGIPEEEIKNADILMGGVAGAAAGALA